MKRALIALLTLACSKPTSCPPADLAPIDGEPATHGNGCTVGFRENTSPNRCETILSGKLEICWSR